MIIGAHSIIYSRNAEADRAFLRDVLDFPNVDVGHGWLIFGLPPSEVAVHPSAENDQHEFYLMSDDIRGLIRSLWVGASKLLATLALGGRLSLRRSCLPGRNLLPRRPSPSGGSTWRPRVLRLIDAEFTTTR